MPALLVLVATIGVVRSVVLDQSSWQGVSFGMFATYDNLASRTVRVTVDGPDGAFRARLPSGLDDDAVHLKVVPTDAAARRLAAATLEEVAGGRGGRVVVEVWRIRLDDHDGRLRLGTERLARGEAAR